MMFAIYRDREVTVKHFNGASYIVRHEMYPHTTWNDSKQREVTRQGHTYWVGARQGSAPRFAEGFRLDKYNRPDSEPYYTPPGYLD